MNRPLNTTLIAQALGHELRRKILRLLAAADRPLSPKMLSDQLGVGLTHVSYHVRQLDTQACLTLTDTSPVRGALAHFYELSRLGQRAIFALDALEAIVDARDRDVQDAWASGGTTTVLPLGEVVYTQEG